VASLCAQGGSAGRACGDGGGIGGGAQEAAPEKPGARGKVEDIIVTASSAARR
jgi:hypothetical protein